MSVSAPASPTPFTTAALSLLYFDILVLKAALGFQDPGCVTLGDVLIAASVAAIIQEASKKLELSRPGTEEAQMSCYRESSPGHHEV